LLKAGRLPPKILGFVGGDPEQRQVRNNEKPNGTGKKATTAKIRSWSIHADVVRGLDRGEPEPEATASHSHASEESSDTAEHAPF
jgi:hypothetical protein